MAKVLVSLAVAFGMYWMYVPEPIIILLIMMGLDLLLGSLAAVANGDFKIRAFGLGILRKAGAFPMLAACHYAEGPLHLAFDLDTYVALALVVYEFISVVESYARLGGPVPKILIMAADKARDLLATTPELPTKEVTTRVNRVEIQSDGSSPAVVRTETIEKHTEPVTPEEPKP